VEILRPTHQIQPVSPSKHWTQGTKASKRWNAYGKLAPDGTILVLDFLALDLKTGGSFLVRCFE